MVDGSSILTFMPVFIPGATISGFLPIRLSTASRSDSVTGGTTEEMIAPSSPIRSI